MKDETSNVVERRLDPSKRERFVVERDRLRQRLEGLCGDWPTAEFDGLLDRMTRIRLKYEQAPALRSYEDR